MVIMRACLLLLAGVTASAWAMRGVYVGIRGGQCTIKNDGQQTGLGMDLGLRMTKAFDLVAQGQASFGSDVLNHWMAGVSGEMRVFRGMADLEFSMGIGAGLYSLTANSNTDLKPGINLGVSLDFVIDRAVHLGSMARYHAFTGGGAYGDNMVVWMVRVGYYFPTTPETSLSLY